MSARGWTGSVAAAIGLAAATGAAQLGVGYGLGAIGWLGDVGGWAAALAWTVWVAALSVVVAALLARRRALATARVPQAAGSSLEGVEGGPWGRSLWRAAVACAAAVGGLAVVPLTALPARQVSTPSTFAPAWMVGWYAAVGVLIGLILAILALSSRAIAANLIATGSWWWLVAVVTVLDAVAGGRGLVPTQLGVWRFTKLTGAAPDGEVAALSLPGNGWWQSIYVPGAVLLVVSALVIGVLAAMPAARRGESRVSVALSGLMGPVLFAAATVLGAPRVSGASVSLEQQSALLIAPYAVLAGLAGSVITAAVAGPPHIAAVRSQSAPKPAGVPPAEPAKVSGVDKPLTPRQARDQAARERAARDAEARYAAAQAARASGGTPTAVAAAPVQQPGGAHKASEGMWRRKGRDGGSPAVPKSSPPPASENTQANDAKKPDGSKK
jgi:hypothetical protein